MKFTRHLPIQTRRDAWVEVDLGAIEQNVREIRRRIPSDITLMAVVKADAYGHGAVMVIPTLQAAGVKMVGVAAMDEALQIRAAGLDIPILVIGAVPDWALDTAVEKDIALTIFSDQHLDNLEKNYQLTGKPVTVHIKVDTGMHRIGMPWKQAADFTARCQASKAVTVAGVFSHLAYADNKSFTQTQLDRWQVVLKDIQELPAYVHIGNSTAALTLPNIPGNLVRMGIGFFGYGPPNLNNDEGWPELIPAMGLKARITSLQNVEPGEAISYGPWIEGDQPDKKDRRVIATLPLGYADGVFRNLSGKINALYKGQHICQVGNITMDQMMMDVTHIADPAVGEVVTLLGREGSGNEQITLTNWADALSTIEYELMCALRVRLPKIYTRT
ncbi:MAG: alanine racemase [Vampirovibrio sp.]|nr:alanine racemase [Vampirovibrio sp.]